MKPLQLSKKFQLSWHKNLKQHGILVDHSMIVLGCQQRMYFKVLINRCLAKMEGGCLGYPGASTVGNQPPDRIPPPWLANPRNPAMSPHSRHPSTKIESVEGKKRRGWEGERWKTLLQSAQRLLKKEKNSAWRNNPKKWPATRSKWPLDKTR